MKRRNRLFVGASLLAACAGFAAVAGGCSSSPQTQVVTGQLSEHDAIAVRATSGSAVVTAAKVRSNGAFTLALPVGKAYTLEVLTTSGVKTLSTVGGWTFNVCQPGAPWNIGTVGSTPPNGGGGEPICNGENCPPGGGTMGSGSNGCPPGDPSCGMGSGSDGCPPGSAGCGSGSGSCAPDDPTCGVCACPANDSDCGCAPGCNPMTDPMCIPPPPPPCEDPNDPATCTDPCYDQPATCGCAPDVPNCWGDPWPPCDPTGMSACPGSPGDPIPVTLPGGSIDSPPPTPATGSTLTPVNPPIDFGCVEPV
jgi:hypothetical protein